MTENQKSICDYSTLLALMQNKNLNNYEFLKLYSLCKKRPDVEIMLYKKNRNEFYRF